MTNERTLKLLRSWKVLNKGLGKLTEEEVAKLLQTERTLKRRPMVIRRLHQRLSALRAKREREELRLRP